MIPIPIVVTNFNREEPLRKLVRWCLGLEGAGKVHVVDTGSTWQPTLDLYAELEKEGVAVHRTVARDMPNECVRRLQSLGSLPRVGMVVFTDPDLEPFPESPKDFLPHMATVLRENQPTYRKVGASLPYEDLPLVGHWSSDYVRWWERRFWQRETRCGRAYVAPVDTTFALYRDPGDFMRGVVGALRTKPPYSLRHVDWWERAEEPSEEYLNYVRTANRQASYSRLFLAYRRDHEDFEREVRKTIATGNNRPMLAKYAAGLP